MKLICERLGEAVREAVGTARPSKIGSATGRAQVGFNRRLCWADGTHTMYGDSSRPDFTGFEGPDDPTHTALFVTDEAGQLMAIGDLAHTRHPYPSTQQDASAI